MNEIELRSAEETPTTLGDDMGNATLEMIDDPNLEELQCEEVDMSDDMMDPMEWTVRKILPIPKVYFWESEATGRDATNISFRTKMWHRSVAVLGRALRIAEFAGEVVANVFGINSSRYQYVMDGMSEEDWKKAQKLNEDRNKEWEEHYAKKEVAGETGLNPDAL